MRINPLHQRLLAWSTCFTLEEATKVPSYKQNGSHTVQGKGDVEQHFRDRDTKKDRRHRYETDDLESTALTADPDPGREQTMIATQESKKRQTARNKN